MGVLFTCARACARSCPSVCAFARLDLGKERGQGGKKSAPLRSVIFFSYRRLCLGAVAHASASGLWMTDMLPSKWEFDAIRSLCRTSVARLKFTRTAGNRSLSTHWLQPLQKWGFLLSCQLRSSLCTEVGKKKETNMSMISLSDNHICTKMRKP